MAVASAIPAQHTADPVRIGPYTVVEPLGHGGAARVYRAESAKTGPVAVKLMHDPESDLNTVAAEFDLAGRVDPAYTAAPVGFGLDNAGPYLVTTLIPRHGPLSRAHRGSVAPAELWCIAAATARAIAAVHAAGVIHCDVKPANLLAYGGSVRIIDFGISVAAGGAEQTTTPYVHFSRGWAAPENSAGSTHDRGRRVLWGCLMTSLACGNAPFRAGTDPEWVYRVRTMSDAGRAATRRSTSWCGRLSRTRRRTGPPPPIWPPEHVTYRSA